MNLRTTTLPLAALFAVAVSACSGDDDHSHGDGGHTGGHSSPYEACDAIIKACHSVDLGEGKPSECHGTAHDATSNDACTPIQAECISACEEAAAELGDAGHHG